MDCASDHRSTQSQSIKHAIILAAGQGRRLRPHTQQRPKCLLDIGGKTLLHHQIDALYASGIDWVTIVTGYQAHRVQALRIPRVQYVYNPYFAHTDSLYSLWLARQTASDGCIILNGDVLFHRGILEQLLQSPYPDALAVDFDAVLAEEEVKVRVNGDRVWALSKTLPDGQGENVGLVKMSAEGSCRLFTTIHELLEQQQHHQMVPYAINALAPSYFVAAIPTGGLPWIEIDFPEDYRRARQVVYAAMHRARPVPSAAPHHLSCLAGE